MNVSFKSSFWGQMYERCYFQLLNLGEQFQGSMIVHALSLTWLKYSV